VFGAGAGRAAAEYASKSRPPTHALIAQANDEVHRLEQCCEARTGSRTASGGERLATIREEMQKTMEESAGIYRTSEPLRRAVGTLCGLRERVDDAAIDDRSLTFNTERLARLELSFMIDVAETIVRAALRREESRGAHQRTDFPARDDRKFLAHSLIHRRPDGMAAIEYVPVTITRWPPAERVYGRAHA
jgi:fumarate reductase flavoprotein subunit